MTCDRQHSRLKPPLMAFIRKRRERQTSMALIITLAMIALIAVLVLVFLLHTSFNQTIEASRTNRSQADIQMQSATDYIINRFLSEISANSTAYTTNNVSLYIPNSNTNMIPVRIISSNITSAQVTSTFFNLIRQSIGTADPNASSTGTATPDSVGRTVGANIWNMPQLNLYPGFTASNQLPNWIYLTLANGVSSTPGSGTVGRFAYNVYDAGGLLDANVVGYTNAVPQEALVKYTEAGVDLTQVASGITQADVNNLVAFRNPDVTPSNYTNYIANAANDGFLLSTTTNVNSTTGLSTANGFTNNYFTSRQDLIRYAQTQNPDLTNAFPYLTTFSRALNQPSYYPDPNRPLVGPASTYGNPQTVGRDNDFNPSLLDYRDANGQPLVKQRFPLSRLAWITDSGPNPAIPDATPANILTYFGLVWDSANYRWVYTSPEGTGVSSMTNVINLLKNIPSARASTTGPDFFELLQASIHIGSLGRDAGTVYTSPPWAPNTDIFSCSSSGYNGIDSDLILQDQNTYYHVLQIGANIIDQYKSNGYPTAIAMTGNTVYGDNNLPLISRIITPLVWHDTSVPGAPVDGYFEFEVWNPHQWNAAAPGPTQFRIRAVSPSNVYAQCVNYGLPGSLYDMGNMGTSPPILFSSGDYTAPTLLTAANTVRNSGTALTGYYMNYVTNPNGVVTSEPIYGLFAGTSTWLSRGAPPYSIRAPAPGVTIVLEYADPSGNYHIYHSMDNMQWFGYIQDGFGISSTTPGLGSLIENINSKAVIDPRTERFGAQSHYTVNSSDDYNYIPSSGSLRFGAGYGGGVSWGVNGYIPNGYTSVFTFNYVPGVIGDGYFNGTYMETISDNVKSFAGNPTYASPNYYTDPDGVVRPAAGAYQNSDTSFDGRPMAQNASATPSKPVILNRPFNSVGELGYVYRDVPWKDIDFFTPLSGDAALLDTFSMEDTTTQTTNGALPLVAGKVNLNTRNVGTLKALLTGTTKDVIAGTSLNSTEAQNIATALVTRTSSTAAGSGPMASRADLVLKFSADLNSGAAYSSPSDSIIKSHRETAIRALADAGDTRTWNLLIDVVVQVGTVPAGGSFVVQGEKHCWLHVAIDRFTGKVIDRYLESVNE